jgi:hypothetical protein
MQRVEGRVQCRVAACGGAAAPSVTSQAATVERPAVLPCHVTRKHGLRACQWRNRAYMASRA